MRVLGQEKAHGSVRGPDGREIPNKVRVWSERAWVHLCWDLRVRDGATDGEQGGDPRPSLAGPRPGVEPRQ